MMQWIKSKILGFKMQRGWAPHGRTAARPLPLAFKYQVRTWWLERCLSFRVLWSAINQTLTPGRYAGSSVPTGRLYATIRPKHGAPRRIGLISTKVVTTAFVNFAVAQLQAETAAFGDFKFHGAGTGAVAEAIGDTALGAQVGTRATGTQTVGASANIYRSVGTLSYTAAAAIVEHGLFNVATAGTLMDRSVFAAINVDNGDSIDFTYELTIAAGS